MGSYHSRQIADFVLLIGEFNFFSAFNTYGIFIFSRYIDDGLMLTNNTNRNQIITNLIPSYPTQISQSRLHQTTIQSITSTLSYHSTITQSCTTKCTIKSTKKHTTNTCILISQQTILNTFSQASSRQKQHNTADSPRRLTITTLTQTLYTQTHCLRLPNQTN